MAVLGFYKTYIVRSSDSGVTIDGLIHVHAAISALWIGLIIAQPLFIRYKKYAIHRTLGKVSYGVFPLLIISFIPLIIRSYRDITSVINPVFDVVLLLLFYTLAILNKKNVAVHMRYMIAIALIFIGPTLARILYYWTDVNAFWGIMITWGSINLILIALLIWDKINQRKYAAPYTVALSGFFVYLVVLFLLKY